MHGNYVLIQYPWPLGQMSPRMSHIHDNCKNSRSIKTCDGDPDTPVVQSLVRTNWSKVIIGEQSSSWLRKDGRGSGWELKCRCYTAAENMHWEGWARGDAAFPERGGGVLWLVSNSHKGTIFWDSEWHIISALILLLQLNVSLEWGTWPLRVLYTSLSYSVETFLV